MRRGRPAMSLPPWPLPDRPSLARVSATLIVRDESRFIEDCLRSLVGVADEIVVVDTGSNDETLEKARRFPIELSHFAWRGDFSAARNFAIEQATGDWILYIDADERLHVPSLRAVHDAVDDDGALGWQLRRIHASAGRPMASCDCFAAIRASAFAASSTSASTRASRPPVGRTGA